MTAVQRLVAANQKLSKVDPYLMELDVEFFHRGDMIIVVIDNEHQVKEICNDLKEPFGLRIDSPQVLTRKSFALVGDITVQRVGKSLRIF